MGDIDRTFQMRVNAEDKRIFKIAAQKFSAETGKPAQVSPAIREALKMYIKETN